MSTFGFVGFALRLLASAPAQADECLCVSWEDTWEWSDCSGPSCGCACADDVVHGGGTTPDTAGGQVCSDDGLISAPRSGASCELTSSTCAETDCCDEANADCPGEDGKDDAACGCDAGSAGAGPAGITAVGLAAIGLLRRRRAAGR